MNAAEPANHPKLAEQETLEFRLQKLAELVVHGASRVDLIEMAMRRWQVSRRTAESYVQQVRERLTGESACTDRLFYLTLSQLQRDQLVGLALRYTFNTVENFNPQVMQSLAAMITAVRGLLDSRDRTAGEIYQLIQEKIDAAKKLTATSNGKLETNGEHEPAVPQAAKANAPTTETPAAAPTAKTPTRNGKKPTPLPPAVLKRLAEAAANHCMSNGESKLERERGAEADKAATCAGCAASP